MAWEATNSAGYAAPAALAADVVVLTVESGVLKVLTVLRADGRRALPGGFVGADEAPEQTARRKLREKTGLGDLYLEQLGAFAEPGRDERGWIPSIAHLALVPSSTRPTDTRSTWIPARGRHRLAFDHRRILRYALERLEGKLWWSNAAVGMLPCPFTLSQARRAYEVIAGARYDPSTFARDLKATGLIAPTGGQRTEAPGRPAALYRFTSTRPSWGAGRRKRIAGQ
jgi:8-oxo-dGTP diphosphatase